jgi:hypothetical protein
MLKPNGLWINIGPLLYHYAEMDDERTIELPLDHVRAIVRKSGFIVRAGARTQTHVRRLNATKCGRRVSTPTTIVLCCSTCTFAI